ncbi:MAG: HD-GYP domain-containing protein [Candidatus Omnitrophota bacterium]
MNTRNYLILTRKYKTAFAAMHSVYRLVSSTFDLKSLILRLGRLTTQIMRADFCCVVLLGANKKYYSLRAVITPKKKHLGEKKRLIRNRQELKVIRTGNALHNGSFMIIPLIAEDVIGTVTVRRTNSVLHFERFDQEILLNIASQVVMAIKNLQLYEEQQRIILGSIKALTTLLDIQAERNSNHTAGFLRFVLSLGRQMNLDERQMCSLQYATMLHDAGKIDIPMEILSKRTKLTGQEFDIIKRHPQKGVKIIRHLQVLRPALPIIMYHHEKYDGTGYPSGLKKGQIPLGARILAIADAFEAMVYGRPYKERMEIKDALREIKNNSGSQFDPDVVEALIKLSKKSKKILQLK